MIVYQYNMAIFFQKHIMPVVKHPLSILAVILIAAAGLRMCNISQEPYWGDEVLSTSIAQHYQHDISGLLSYLREVEVHPPLYYFLIKLWGGWWGFSELSLRFISLVFGLGVVCSLYYTVKRISFSDTLALLAAFLAAIWPMQIEYSQEARPYVIFCFFGLWHAYAWWQFHKTGKKIYLPAYVLSGLIGWYLHYSFIYIIISTLSYGFFSMLWQKDFQQRFLPWLMSLAAIFLGMYWWLYSFLYKIALGSYELFGLKRALASVRGLGFFDGVFNQLIWTVKDRNLFQIEVFAVFLAKIMIIALAIYAIRSAGRSAWLTWRSNPLIFLIWIFLISSVLFLFSPSSQNYSMIFERHLIFNSLIIIVLLSWLFVQVPFRIRMVAVSVLLLSLLNFDIKVMADDSVADPENRDKIYADFINQNYRQGDIVISNYEFVRSNLNYFLRPEIDSLGFYPPQLLDWQDDLWSSRDTIGLIGNESQLRIWTPTPAAEKIKMDHIIRRYRPRRIWIVNYGDYNINHTLSGRDWRHAQQGLGEMFPVDLFVARPHKL